MAERTAPYVKSQSPARRLLRLVRDERGVTAIEFGVLAIPFFTIMVAIIETSLVFLSSQILDSAVNDTSRLIRTGEAQTAGVTATEFRELVCDRLYGLFDCSKLKIKVGKIDNFTAATTAPPLSTVPGSEGQWTVTEGYGAGAGSDIVLVEVYYKWPVLINFGGFSLDDVGDGSRLLAAVRVFKNEPF